MPVAIGELRVRAISVPWSQVSDRAQLRRAGSADRGAHARRATGSARVVRRAGAAAARTGWLRSTRVPIADWFLRR